MVTAADLGKPWVVAENAPTTGGKSDEECPGQPSTVNKVTSVASLNRNLTEGKGIGVNIGRFRLGTLPTEDASEVKAAYAREHQSLPDLQGRQRALRRVQRSRARPRPTVPTRCCSAGPNALYYDKAHKKLAYARHTVVARTGRVVSYVSYAFLTTKKDPGAEDFSRASRLLEIQLGEGRQHVRRVAAG